MTSNVLPFGGASRLGRGVAAAAVAAAAMLGVAALPGKAAFAATDAGITFPDEVATVSTSMGSLPAGQTTISLEPSDAAVSSWAAAHPGQGKTDLVAAWVENVKSVTVGATTLAPAQISDWIYTAKGPTADLGELPYYQLRAGRSAASLSLPIALFDTTDKETCSRTVVIESEGFAPVTGTVTYRNLGATTMTVRVLSADADKGGRVLASTTYTDSELRAIAPQDGVCTAANCGMAGLRSYKSEGIYLTDLLADSGYVFGERMSLNLRVSDSASTNDGAGGTETGYMQSSMSGFTSGRFTYEKLMEPVRYYYPAMWDDTTTYASLGGKTVYELIEADKDCWKGADATSVELKRILGASKVRLESPILAWGWNEGVVAWGGTDPSAQRYASGTYNAYTSHMTYRFLYGMRAAEDGSAYDDNTTFDNAYGVFGVDLVAPSFSDLSDSDWYADAALRTAARGLIRGVGGTDVLDGNGVLTRSQLATILWRYAQPDEEAAYDAASARNETGMADVADAQWYTGAANWAVAAGVINGKETGDTRTFDPDGAVTFQEMVAMLVNLKCADPAIKAAVKAQNPSVLDCFADASSVSEWARKVVAYGYEAGLFSGYPTDTGRYLRADEDISRGRVSGVLDNAYKKGIL